MINRVTVLPVAMEQSLSDRQYRLWSDMLETRTGVEIARDRQDFVRGQISRRIRELEVEDPDSYFRDVLETVDGVREWGLLLDRLLIKETRFFRHGPSFEYLHKRLLRATDSGMSTAMSLWSAGCSTGEEAYSLAITADRVLSRAGLRPSFGVIGTDICRGALEFAREGIYFRNVLPDSTPGLLSDHLEPLDKHRFQISSRMRRRVCFLADNLLASEQSRFAERVDVIFCQNVLVYFKRWRRRQIISRLMSHLKIGGCLLLAPGEMSDWTPSGARRDPEPDVLAYIRTE